MAVILNSRWWLCPALQDDLVLAGSAHRLAGLPVCLAALLPCPLYNAEERWEAWAKGRGHWIQELWLEAISEAHRGTDTSGVALLHCGEMCHPYR